MPGTFLDAWDISVNKTDGRSLPSWSLYCSGREKIVVVVEKDSKHNKQIILKDDICFGKIIGQGKEESGEQMGRGVEGREGLVALLNIK